MQSDIALLNGLPFIHALRGFSKVVESCFSNHLLDRYETDIAEFKRLYLSLGVSVTPKVIQSNLIYLICIMLFSWYFCLLSFRFCYKILSFQAHIIFQHIAQFLKLENTDPSMPAVGQSLNFSWKYNFILFIRSWLLQRTGVREYAPRCQSLETCQHTYHIYTKLKC